MYFLASEHEASDLVPEVAITHVDGAVADTAPPSYASGIVCRSVGQIAKQPASTSSEIAVSVHRYESTVFDTGDIVVGDVIITPRQDMALGAIGIRLTMTEIVRFDKSIGPVRHSYGFTLARHTIPLEAYPEDMVLREGFSYTVPYLMIVPQSLPTMACICTSGHGTVHNELLPSHGLSHAKLGNAGEGLQDDPGQVVYEVEASVTKPPSDSTAEPLVQAIGKCRVPVRPSTLQPPPPVSSGPYSATVALSSGLLKKSTIGAITATVHEPVRISKSRPTISVEITLLYDLSGGSRREVGPPPGIKAINYSLDAISTASSKPLLALEGQKALSERYKTTLRQTLLKSSLTMAKLDWAMRADGTMQTAVTIPLTLPVEGPVVQSYTGCLTSRHYELSLSLCLSGTCSSLALTVPVTVSAFHQRASSVVSICGAAPSLQEDRSEAPAYEELDRCYSGTSSFSSTRYAARHIQRLPSPAPEL